MDPLPGQDPNFAAQIQMSPGRRNIALPLRAAEKTVSDKYMDSIPASTSEKKPSGSEAPSNSDNEEDESHGGRSSSAESRRTPESGPKTYSMTSSTRSTLRPKAPPNAKLIPIAAHVPEKVSSPIWRSRQNKRTGSGAKGKGTSPKKVPAPPASCVRGRAVDEPADDEGFKIVRGWTGVFLYKRPKIRDGGHKWTNWVQSKKCHEGAPRSGDQI